MGVGGARGTASVQGGGAVRAGWGHLEAGAASGEACLPSQEQEIPAGRRRRGGGGMWRSRAAAACGAPAQPRRAPRAAAPRTPRPSSPRCTPEHNKHPHGQQQHVLYVAQVAQHLWLVGCGVGNVSVQFHTGGRGGAERRRGRRTIGARTRPQPGAAALPTAAHLQGAEVWHLRHHQPAVAQQRGQHGCGAGERGGRSR